VEDFDKLIINDVVVEIVNLTRATYKEAAEFKSILIKDIETGFNKVVVDIQECDFIDSTFLGVLVFALKEISKNQGDIRIVKPGSIVRTFMEKVGTLKIFNVFNTVEEAVYSYDSEEIQDLYRSYLRNSGGKRLSGSGRSLEYPER
jgi:anti-anti-sigma factor